MNFQEEEDMKLHRAVKSLPQYSPSDDVWLDIMNFLDKEEREQTKLIDAVVKLPQYEAPAMLWDVIETQLPKHEAKVVSIFSIARMAMAAAVIGFAATLTLFWYASENQKDSISYSYSTEQIENNAGLSANTSIEAEDEQTFAQVAQICEQQSFICEQPVVKQLRSELEELNDARNQLKEALGAYGSDEDIQQQLLAIEQERTDVLKKIMDQI